MSTVAPDEDDDGIESSVEEESRSDLIVQVKNTFITLEPMFPIVRHKCSAPAVRQADRNDDFFVGSDLTEDSENNSKRTTSTPTVGPDENDDGVESSVEEEVRFDVIIQVKKTFITLEPMFPAVCRQYSAPVPRPNGELTNGL